MVQFTKIAAAALIAGSAVAHPGEVHEPAQIRREIADRDVVANRYVRSLGKCSTNTKAREASERAAARRASKAEKLRQARGISTKPFLHRRDLATLKKFEAVNHNMTGEVTTFDKQTLFGAKTQVALTPEDTIGPYYVTGEYLRQDLVEGQSGVPMHLEFQFTDVNTCEPLPELLADIWACNATGVYSGVDATGQGGLNSTFLRGLQKSDEDGVVSFDTIFPGHYTGRATHQHVVVHQGSKLLSNGSYTGGKVSHIGQVFFDTALRNAVEATSPYNTNTQDVTTNDEDMWTPSAANNTAYDPFPEFVYLDPSDITKGLLVWINIGIDTTANHTDDATNAAYLAADGGHSTGNQVGGGGDGGAMPSGAMPSGAMPSGAAPSGTPPSKRAPHSYAFNKLFAGSAKRWI